MYCKKSDSPKNGHQIYINGKRCRSIRFASEVFEIDFSNLFHRFKISNGFFEIKKFKIISEKWIFEHPLFLLNA